MQSFKNVTELKLVHEEFSSDLTLLVVSYDRSSKKESNTVIQLSSWDDAEQILISNYQQFFNPIRILE